MELLGARSISMCALLYLVAHKISQLFSQLLEVACYDYCIIKFVLVVSPCGIDVEPFTTCYLRKL